MRLNQIMCLNLRDKILHHRFTDDRKALREREYELAGLCYVATYSATTQRRMYTLPKGWLAERDDIGVAYGNDGNVCYLNFGPDESGHVQRKRFLDRSGRVAVKLDPFDDPLLTDLLEQYHRDMDTHQDRYTQARRDVVRALEQANTVKQLVTAWPEVKPFVDQLSPSATTNLPAIPVKELNRALGLPVGATA